MPIYFSGVTSPSLHLLARSVVGCLLVAVLSGCAAGSETATPIGADEYNGNLRSYNYGIKIWWNGERCERREIKMERRCGLCRNEVTRARIYDHDCDGVAEQFLTRGEHQNFEIDTRTLEEEAWHAFYLFVPPSQTGDSRKVLLTDRQ